PSGSPRDGLTAFGRDVVQACESLGVIVDLAHISPAGFDEILAITTKPPIISHTNARKYYDIERNITDEQIKMMGERRGVIGVNGALVSPTKEESTLDRYIDHIEHVADLIGIDCVGIGFDFFEFIYCQWPESRRKALAEKFTTPHFIPELRNHSDARNLTRRLIERGFSDHQIEKILRQRVRVPKCNHNSNQSDHSQTNADHGRGNREDVDAKILLQMCIWVAVPVRFFFHGEQYLDCLRN